jgi:hypothetical protein
VIRTMRSSSTSSSTDPRQRGGVPGRPVTQPASSASSPLTRGCSGQQGARRAVQAAFPANAEVIRGPDDGPSSSRRPPHRRGGVPFLGNAATPNMVSYPPMRERSGPAKHETVRAVGCGGALNPEDEDLVLDAPGPSFLSHAFLTSLT